MIPLIKKLILKIGMIIFSDNSYAKIVLLSSGKISDKLLNPALSNYLTRLHYLKPSLIEIGHYDTVEHEAEELEKKINSLKKNSSHLDIILLKENGTQKDSVAFASWIKEEIERSKRLVFVISGPQGFCPSFIKKYPLTFSFSKLTFPHRFLPLLFLEQLYRAQTIIEKRPYHY